MDSETGGAQLEGTKMEQILSPVAEIYRLNTRLLLHCVEGVSDEHGAARVLAETNSMTFIMAHVIDARYYVTKILGRPAPNPLEASLGDVARIEDVTELPSIADLEAMWVTVGRHLDACLEAAAAELLATPSPAQFPVGDDTLLGGLAFLAHHEAYHVGQLAFLRKGLGYPAMAYQPAGDET